MASPLGTPVELGGYLAVVEMVDMAEWGMRGQLYAHVARRSIDTPTEGACVSVNAAADALGTDRRYVHKLFRYLRRERVLIRVEQGSGRRPARWRVNPDLRGWREVPWRVSAELASWRVLGLGAVPESPVAARSHGAPLAGVAARSHGAPLNRLAARSHGAPQTIHSGALHGAPLRGVEPGASTFGPGGSPPSSASPNLSRERGSDLQRAVEVVEEATDCAVFGRLLDELAGFVNEVGADAFVAAAGQVDPTGMKAPMFVRAVKRVHRGAESGDPAGAERAARRRQLDSERRRLLVMIEQHETHQADLEASGVRFADDDLERFRDELAACEAELAALSATEGAA